MFFLILVFFLNLISFNCYGMKDLSSLQELAAQKVVIDSPEYQKLPVKVQMEVVKAKGTIPQRVNFIKEHIGQLHEKEIFALAEQIPDLYFSRLMKKAMTPDDMVEIIDSLPQQAQLLVMKAFVKQFMGKELPLLGYTVGYLHQTMLIYFTYPSYAQPIIYEAPYIVASFSFFKIEDTILNQFSNKLIDENEVSLQSEDLLFLDTFLPILTELRSFIKYASTARTSQEMDLLAQRILDVRSEIKEIRKYAANATEDIIEKIIFRK